MKLFQLILMLPLISCTSSPRPLGEQTLDISDFDFATPVSALLPKHYEDLEYKGGWYNIPSADGGTDFMYRDTVIGWHTNEPLWVEYRQQGTNSANAHICFEKHIFNAANLVTDLDGRIRMIAGKAAWDTVEASNALVQRITKRYGAPKHTRANFVRDYDLFTWTLPDRTIKYAVVQTDESNVLKLDVDHDAEGNLTDIREGKREIRTKSYIFILDGEWAEKFISEGQLSGDFVYCR